MRTNWEWKGITRVFLHRRRTQTSIRPPNVSLNCLVSTGGVCFRTIRAHITPCSHVVWCVWWLHVYMNKNYLKIYKMCINKIFGIQVWVASRILSPSGYVNLFILGNLLGIHMFGIGARYTHRWRCCGLRVFFGKWLSCWIHIVYTTQYPAHVLS